MQEIILHSVRKKWKSRRHNRSISKTDIMISIAIITQHLFPIFFLMPVVLLVKCVVKLLNA